ncbi:tRNA lysidine(34) synthetase TilS [Mesorhizobium sp. A623]
MLTSPRAEAGPAAETDPVADADLPDSLFSSIDFSGGALVAISGGSDSTALLLLLKRFLDRNAPSARLLAVTVDHNLRSGSAAEAQAVGRLCAERGIAHLTVAWTGPKPSSGVSVAAREARYRLLARAACDAGIGIVLAGHTADDQAETVLMRQARLAADARTGARGLAGMAPATLYDWKTWIVRPLLGTRRAALRDFLRGEGTGWADDPTNLDPAYERPRIRALIDGRGFAQAIALAGREAAARETASLGAAALVRAFASQPAAGLVRLDPAFAKGDESAAIVALRVLLATMGGVSFPPDEARAAALLARFGGTPFRATLSRAVVDVRRAGIFLYRELRDLPAAAPAFDGMVWDGRRRIRLPDSFTASIVAPAGSSAQSSGLSGQNDVPASLFRAAHAAEPVFSGNSAEQGSSSGHLRHGLISPVVAPFARFLPGFDLALAAAVAALVGAPPLPASPLMDRQADQGADPQGIKA